MNILIRDYIAFEVYDTSNGEIISRDLRLRDEIRNLLITELTTIANTYSEEYLNDPTKDKSVDAKEIEDYVNVFMEFGNVILESFEYNFESSDLMDEVIDLSEETNLLIRTGVTPTIEVTTVINPISLILNTDFIELDSSTPLTNGYINEFQLIPTVTGTNRPVIYSTVDPDIISVSSNGHITLSGVKDGLATIYATIEGYDVYKEVRVQVSEETPASSIKFYGPYISGYPDNSFKANNIITRAEIATMFSRVLMLDINEDGSSKYDEKSFEIPSYSDVDKDDWSYIYVEIARKEGLMSGYADGTFKPDGSMSRAEIAVIISNAWELLGVKSSKLANHYILDVDSQHWAFDAINKVYNAKIVSGYDDGTFRPDNYTTRAEIVIMINSILNRRDYKPIEESFNDILRSHWAYGAIESAIRIQEVKYDIGDN